MNKQPFSGNAFLLIFSFLILSGCTAATNYTYDSNVTKSLPLVLPGDWLIDNFTNFTQFISYPNVGINMSGFGKELTNSTYNISFMCPAFPYINRTIILTNNTPVVDFNSSYGLNISGNFSSLNNNCSSPILNSSPTTQNISYYNYLSNLSSGSCYSNLTIGSNVVINVSICAEAKTATEFSLQNTSLLVGQIASDAERNYTVSCAINASQLDALANLTECRQTPGWFCRPEATRLPSCSNKFLLYTNYNETHMICIDNLTTICSGDEILDGNLLGCFQSYTTQYNASYATLQLQYNQTLGKMLDAQVQVQRYEKGEDIAQRVANENNLYTEIGLGIILLIAAGLLLVKLMSRADRIHAREEKLGSLPHQSNVRAEIRREFANLMSKLGDKE